MQPASGKQPRRVRYRVGLGVMVSLLVAATVAVLGWATYVTTRTAIIELTNARVHELLGGLNARVQSHLLQAVTAVQLSNMLIGSSAMRDDADVLGRHFTQVLRANPGFSWASYSSEKGDFTGAYRSKDGALHVSQTTLRAGGTLSDYTVGKDGAWVLPLHTTNYGYDPRTEDYFKQANEAKKLVWIGPVIFYDEGLPGITCANPNLAADGSLLGVFTIDFNLNHLSDFVEQLHFGEHGKVFIFKQGNTPQDRIIIAYPGLKMAQVTGQGAKGKLIAVPDVGDPVLQAFTTIRAARANTADGQFSFQYAGQGYLAGFQNIEIEGGPTWLLGAFAPESDFMGALARNKQVVLGIMAFALFVGLLATLAIARRISVPLMRLASEMEEIGNFELPNRPRMKTIFKEVAVMDESLLNMKGSLRSFSYYVPKDLVRAMLASGQEATLQGQTREMTIYFSDIAGMTSIAEGMNPDQLVQHLSRYFDEMTQVVESHGGTVDKFIGDAIMAFWGAPVATADHAAHACETAILSQRRLAELRAAPETPWLANIQARIGIATGEVMVGNVGSRDRFNYTVMGDTVNLASRLESLNKLYGTAILIGEGTWRAAQETIVARPVDIVQVKGKRRCVRVWEPLCLALEADPAARKLAEFFVQGLAAYVARDFQRAAQCYESALRLCPQDRPAEILLDRCRQFMLAPPPGEWDGAYVATEK